MSILNLTPHDIVVRGENGERVFAAPAPEKVCRVATTSTEDGIIDGIPVFKTVFGEVENLPAPEIGTVYIVSAIVINALAGTRPDVVAPDTGKTAIRDEKGLVKAVTRFTR